MSEIFSEVSFSTGVVKRQDLGYLVATKDDMAEDNIAHARIYSRKAGNIGGMAVGWAAVSVSICYQPDDKLIVLGEIGQVVTIGGGQRSEEQIRSGTDSPESRGPVREVRGIAKGRAYVVGTGRQAYRRDGPNTWVRIDQTVQILGKDMTETSFESIDGFSESDIYAVGWKGEIWHYDGVRWTQKTSPTNLALYKVRCCGDGKVYACGQVGTIVRGRGDEWEIIEHGVTEEDLWGLEWFNNRLYLSTTHLLYELQSDTLTRVQFGDEPPPITCYHLSAADGIMWSIGFKDVMEFNGQTWIRIV